MKIQWILIAILLAVGVASEAQENLLPENFNANTAGIDETRIPFIPVVGFGSQLAAINAANTAIEKCNVSARKASRICVASSSPEIQTGIVAVTGIMSAIDLASSTSDSCKKFGSAMDIAKAAMTAYTGACAVVQMNCNSSCTEAGRAIGAAQKAGAAGAAAAETGYVSTIRKCNGYKLSMAAAGAGIMSLLAQSILAGKCEKATTAVDCVADSMNPACKKALDCSLAANVSNISCICLKAPNTAGCAGYTGSNGNQVNAVDDSVEALDPGNLDIQSPNLGADAVTGGVMPASGGNGVAPTGGGGGGGLSGGTDGGKGNQKVQGKALNTNILSGYEGGGGGGSRGSYSGSSSDSGLQAYLPKGAKDPARNPAMQLFGNGQVTGAGSKSNFEKVSERYGDTKSTLIAP